MGGLDNQCNVRANSFLWDKGLVRLGTAVILVWFLGCAPVFDDPQAEVGTPQNLEDLSSQVNAKLQLRTSTVARLSLGGSPQAPVVIPIEGHSYSLDLHPHSVRAQGYEIRVQKADGSYEQRQPGPVRTLRGSVAGMPESIVAASLEDDGLYAWISLPEGKRYLVQPVASVLPQADVAYHVIYHEQDMLEPQLVDLVLPNPEETLEELNTRSANTLACGTGLCEAELAIDADVEFFEYWGSVSAVEDRINSVINAANVQYERDVDITHTITAIIVRTAEPDPYSSSDGYELLSAFRSHWLNNHSDIPRDVAQLFTGKDITYSGSDIIGLAWLNAVCGTLGYSVVQQYGTTGYAADLSAHELGHNWGADHCSCSNPPFTMNPYITGSNAFSPVDSMPDIVTFRDSRTCLEGLTDGCGSNEDCDDADACNGVETCVDGACQAGNGPDCNDGDACTADSCDPGTGDCANDPIDCDDGNACTTDVCDPADGCAHSMMGCDDGDACTADSCDSASGNCVNDLIDCGDGDDCTIDACDSASGCTYTMMDCDDDDACTADSCDSVAGTCANDPINCDDGNACTTDVCDPAAGCSNLPINCDDDDLCTLDSCDPVAGCLNDTMTCNDADPCTVDSCDPSSGCVNESSGFCCGNGLCEDGEDCQSCPEDCTSGTTGCGNGVCEPGTGEDCLSCPSDCRGKQNGKPSNRFCCGPEMGDGQNPVGCDDPRCTEGEFECSNLEMIPFCCGDGVCGAGEDPCMCSTDCPPEENELFCGDGLDDDCDGAIDCDDPDCDLDDTCVNVECIPTFSKEKGSRCTDGQDNDCDGALDCSDADCANNAACL